MLKWFGAGVGCTTAVALGVYALNIEEKQTVTLETGRVALPLESEDPTPASSRSTLASATKGLAPVLISSGEHRTTASRPSSVRIVTPNDRTARRSTSRPSSSAEQTASGNGWTLRFVSSPPASPSTNTAQQVYDANERTVLARRIQREMKRVGCSSRISAHGYWDKTTRSAALRFARNRNSAIPTGRPDEALLSMLKNYRGTQCGATQVVRPAATRSLRLKQPPRLANRTVSNAITTGWSTQVSTFAREPVYSGQQRGTVISSNAVTPSSGRATLQPARPSRANIQRRKSFYADSRMALGARAQSAEPTTPNSSAPLTVRPNTTFGPTDINRDSGFIAPRYDAERIEALRRERARAERRAERAKARKRRAAKRRYYTRRRRKSWKQRVFEGYD